MAKLLPMQNELQDPAPRTLGGWGGAGQQGTGQVSSCCSSSPSPPPPWRSFLGYGTRALKETQISGGGGAKTHIQLA